MSEWQDTGGGRWKLTIPGVDGAAPSVYRGTKAEIAEMLAQSQANANRRIAELRTNGNGNGHHQAPQPLSPAEKLQTFTDLQDPATATTAITRVVESAMGSTMEEERQRRAREEAERQDRIGGEVAAAFVEETEDYYKTNYNAHVLHDYMLTRGMDMTSRAAYDVAFEELKEAKLLQLKPEGETETEPEEDDGQRNAPAARPVPKAPTRVSTGVTGRDISGQPPRPTTRLRYSREQLDNMGRHEYRQLMLTDRAELERCEQFYATHPVKKPA